MRREGLDWTVFFGLAGIAFAVAILLFGCAPKHVNAEYPKVPQVNSTYTYQEVKQDQFIIYVPATQPGEAQAKEELCTVSFVCIWQTAGKIFFVERKRK